MKRATRRLSLLTIMLAPAAALAAPIGLETALPIARDEYLVRTQFMDLERSAISGPAEVSAQAMMAALGYGFSPRLAGFAVLPWLNKELKMPAATRRAEDLAISCCLHAIRCTRTTLPVAPSVSRQSWGLLLPRGGR